MTDKQQIEQLEKDLDKIFSSNFNGDYESGIKDFAKRLYKANYRQVPKNAVVLTREEYDSLMGNIAKITKAWSRAMKEAERLHNIKLDLEHQMTQQGLTEYVGADVIEAEARKEAAKQIYITGKHYYYKYKSKDVAMNMFADWIKETFGLEVDND